MSGVAFSPASTSAATPLILSSSRDGTARLWDVSARHAPATQRDGGGPKIGGRLREQLNSSSISGGLTRDPKNSYSLSGTSGRQRENGSSSGAATRQRENGSLSGGVSAMRDVKKVALAVKAGQPLPPPAVAPALRSTRSIQASPSGGLLSSSDGGAPLLLAPSRGELPGMEELEEAAQAVRDGAGRRGRGMRSGMWGQVGEGGAAGGGAGGTGGGGEAVMEVAGGGRVDGWGWARGLRRQGGVRGCRVQVRQHAH